MHFIRAWPSKPGGRNESMDAKLSKTGACCLRRGVAPHPQGAPTAGRLSSFVTKRGCLSACLRDRWVPRPSSQQTLCSQVPGRAGAGRRGSGHRAVVERMSEKGLSYQRPLRSGAGSMALQFSSKDHCKELQESKLEEVPGIVTKRVGSETASLEHPLPPHWGQGTGCGHEEGSRCQEGCSVPF